MPTRFHNEAVQEVFDRGVVASANSDTDTLDELLQLCFVNVAGSPDTPPNPHALEYAQAYTVLNGLLNQLDPSLSS